MSDNELVAKAWRLNFLVFGGVLFLLTACGSRTELWWQRPQVETSEPELVEAKKDTVGQLDLLFVIDNSGSMADKQQLLARAVPAMVNRLIHPLCVSAAGDTVASNNQTCPENYAFEFAPIADIHIGIISSSLGGHGSPACQRDSEGRHSDDGGHLIPTVRVGVSDPEGLERQTV